MPALSFNSARSAQVRDEFQHWSYRDAITNSTVLSYSFRSRVRLGPLCFATGACPLPFDVFVDGCSCSSGTNHGGPHLLSPRMRQAELDQKGNSQTLACTSLPLWCKADYQTQSLQVIHCLVLAGWRIIAKYFWLDNATLEHCSWRIKSDSNGVHGPPRYLEKRKRVSSRHMWRLWRDAC